MTCCSNGARKFFGEGTTQDSTMQDAVSSGTKGVLHTLVLVGNAASVNADLELADHGGATIGRYSIIGADVREINLNIMFENGIKYQRHNGNTAFTLIYSLV